MYKPKVIMAGTVCTDEYYKIPYWIPEGDKTEIHYISSEMGGMVPNAACVLAALGIYTQFYDHMNFGSLNQKLLKNLRDFGVNTELVTYSPDIPDRKCFIFLSEKERTVMAIQPPINPIPVPPHLLTAFCQATYFYSTLHNFEAFDDPIGLQKKLQDAHVKIAFDIENHHYSHLDRILLRNADLLFFNEYGFQSYCASDSDYEKHAKKLLQSQTKCVVITLGHRGCLCYTSTEHLYIPGISVTVTDPTGAGDTFNAAFLKGLLDGKSLYETAVFANSAAAHAVTQIGPRAGAVSEKRIQEFSKNHSLEIF